MACKTPPIKAPEQQSCDDLGPLSPVGFDLQQELFGNDWLQMLLPSVDEDTCLSDTTPSMESKAADTSNQTTSTPPKAPTTTKELYAQKVDPKTNRWRKMAPEEVLQHKLESALNYFRGIKGPQQKEAGYTHEVNGELYVYGSGDEDEEVQVKDMVGPSSKQFIGRAFASDVPAPGGVGPTQKKLMVLNPDGTVTEEVANNNGMVQLPGAAKNPKDQPINPTRPTPFLGYKSYNMNDVQNTVNGKQVEQNDQYSSPESIARMLNLSLDYQTMFPDSCLQIGDISTETGGSPNQENDKKPHGSHYGGTQFDLRYVKGKEAQVIGDGKPTLDVSDKLRTKALLELARGEGFNNFILGTALQGQFGADVSYRADHNNHMHFGIGNGIAEKQQLTGQTAKSTKTKGGKKVAPKAPALANTKVGTSLKATPSAKKKSGGTEKKKKGNEKKKKKTAKSNKHSLS